MSLQDSLSQAAKRHAEDTAERVRKAQLDIACKTFDRAAAYTNLIMFGGYAGAFAVWNFTRERLLGQAEIWVALLLTISLAAFVFFEVFKMVISSKIMFKQRNLLTKAMPPEEFLSKLQALGQEDDTRTAKFVIPLWVLSLSVAVSTAIGAVGICLWNFLAILICGPAI